MIYADKTKQYQIHITKGTGYDIRIRIGKVYSGMSASYQEVHVCKEDLSGINYSINMEAGSYYMIWVENYNPRRTYY